MKFTSSIDIDMEYSKGSVKKVLVIDEDQDWLSAMRVFFERQGYDTVLINSYRAGFLILHSFKPDLIFLDIKPDKLDGPILCKKIKEQAGYRHTPVVFTFSSRESLKIYQNYGASAFLKKPFQLAALLNILLDHL